MCVHGAAFALIAATGIPLWAGAIVAVILCTHLVFCIRRHALLLGSDAVIAIDTGSGNVLSAETRSGEWREYEILGGTYVMPFLTILQLRHTESGAVRRIVLLPDSLPTEDFRRLRVRLRWQEHARNA
jgi:toxin CptA